MINTIGIMSRRDAANWNVCALFEKVASAQPTASRSHVGSSPLLAEFSIFLEISEACVSKYQMKYITLKHI